MYMYNIYVDNILYVCTVHCTVYYAYTYYTDCVLYMYMYIVNVWDRKDGGLREREIG